MYYSIKFKDLNNLFKRFKLIVEETNSVSAMGTWHSNVLVKKNNQILFQLKNSRPGCGVTIIHNMGNLSYDWEEIDKDLKQAIKELLEYIMYQNDTWCAFHHTSFTSHPKYELMLKELGFKIASNFENGRHGGKKSQFLIKEFGTKYKNTLHETFLDKIQDMNKPKPTKKATVKKKVEKSANEKRKRKRRESGKSKTETPGDFKKENLIWSEL